MTSSFLESRVVPELVHNGARLCLDKVESAQTLNRTCPDHVAIWTSERSDYAVKPVLYLFSSGSGAVHRFDLVTSALVTCPQISTPADDVTEDDKRCAVVVGGVLFVVSVRAVKQFRKDEMCWERVATGKDIYDAGVSASADSIIVVGGKEDGKAVHSFHVMHNAWTSLPPLKISRRGPAATCVSHVLYVIGGYNDKRGYLATLDSLNLVTKEWTSLPNMAVPRFRLSCVTLGEDIYVIGGRDDVRDFVTVEVYSTSNATWVTPSVHMVTARSCGRL